MLSFLIASSNLIAEPAVAASPPVASVELNQWSNALAELGLPGLLLIPAIPLVFIAVYALYAGVYGERKVSAFIQDRIGPNETGKWGLLQTIADILKLIQKEDVVPAAADKVLYVLGPIIVFVGAFAAYAVLPFGPAFIGADLNVGVFYAVSIVSVEAVGILMCGWGSNNKWSLFGAVRSVAQIVSYEIPAGLAILTGVMMAGTLSMHGITLAQSGIQPDGTNNGLGFLNFFIFQSPVAWIAFIVYFIASLAECNRAPFDIPEAESELVSGYFTEYGGMKFAMIFLAEYASMFMVSVIISTLFLGGWNSPLPNIGPVLLNEWTNGPIWGVFWIMLKGLFFIFVQMWVRWTLPRFRVDQLMYLCWKVLTPFAMAALVITAFWEMYVRNPVKF
ncbi:MAG: NADH-quinone oxidoreductase subunit NuoH [Chloroherpetonaceae bacterium]|nr:NADH-quinone oxidoreductase subunit NuoH [Chloroherpetonaceae bacterium]MDW8466684.1 NADH-quinone oxidoreductase subunit NuoH [Chloroherpetonaceae bacterium]